ncbi:MAG: YegS/Rv2252/BmrU family lipid kinase [Eubacterium sp.]|nr:YegS/Rv2252/BmrU family lipid kinase [Eubacterium sp.]
MEKEKRVLLIINPIAGKQTAKNKMFEIVNCFIQEGFEVTLHLTQYAGDATRKVMDSAQRFERIVCCGGDGTLSEVIAGVEQVAFDGKIGYIPTGTTNDFARSLGFSKNTMRAAKVAAGDYDFPCDIGRFGDSFFTYIAAFGAFTDVAYGTDQALKNIFGQMAYFFEGIKHLTSLKSYGMTVKAGQREITGDFIFGAVTNSYSIGGNTRLIPDATDTVALDDGKFEVLLIRYPKNILELNTIIQNLMTQNFDQQQVLFFQESQISFHAEGEALSWTLDGEEGSVCSDVDISCLPRRVSFVAEGTNS